MATLIRLVLGVILIGLVVTPAAAQDLDFTAVPKITVGVTNQGSVGAINGNGVLGASTPSALTGFEVTDVAVAGGQIFAVGFSPTDYLLMTLRARSDGTFNFPHTVSLPGFPIALGVGHINLDGVEDIVVSVSQVAPTGMPTSLLVFDGRAFEQAGVGDMVDAAVIPVPLAAGDPLSVTVQRLNGDAFADIAYVTSDDLGGEVFLILSVPTDSQILGPSTTIVSAPLSAPTLPDVHPQAIAADVLNVPTEEGGAVDAAPDITVATTAGLEIFQMIGGGLVRTGMVSTEATATGVVLADVTRDNLVDLIAINAGSGNVSTNVATAGGGYGAPLRSAPVGTNPISLALINFNNDGIPDLVVTSAPLGGGAGEVNILQGNGSGGFTVTRTLRAPESPVQTPVAVATGRLDPRSTTDDIVIGDLSGIAFLSAFAGYRPVPASPATLPDLTITEATASPPMVLPGGNIGIVNTVRSGNAPSGPITIRFLLSTDLTPSPDDIVLGTRVVMALAANASDRVTTVLTLPGNTSAGQRRILVVADPDNTIPESNENNNVRVTGVITIVLPDLTVRTVRLAPAVVGLGGNITVMITVANVAGAPAAAPASIAALFLSRNASVAGGVLLAIVPVPALAPGAATTLTLRLVLPPDVTAGRHFGVVRVDFANAVREAREDNNQGASATPVLVGAEVGVTALTAAPLRVLPGGSVTMLTTLRNGGGDSTVIGGLFSLVPVNAAGIPTGSDIPIGETPPTSPTPPPGALGSRLPDTPLGPGQSRTRSDTLQLPADTVAGNFRIRLTLQPSVPDADSANDMRLSNPFAVVLPDLTVPAVAMTPLVVGIGGNVSLTATITNVAGAPAAAGATTAEWYLSTNRSTQGAILLGTMPVPALPPGASFVIRQRATLPGILGPGRYFGVVRVDPGNAVREAREDNNTGTSLVPLLVGAEVGVTALTAAPLRVLPGGNVTALATLRNGGGDSVTVGGVYSLVPVNAAGIPTGPDIPLGDTPPPGALASTLPATLLAPSATRVRSDNVRMPVDALEGDYRLRLTLDPGAPDADPGNNQRLSNSFRIVLPDLTVPTVTLLPAVLGSGGNLSMTATILNAAGAPAGAGATTAEWYLSRNRSAEGALLVATTPVPALGPGASAVLRRVTTLPAGLAADRYFGVVRVDPGNAVREARENNNDGASITPVLIGAEAGVTALTATPARVLPGGDVTAMATLRNSGGDAVTVAGVYSLVPVNAAGNPTGPDIPLEETPPPSGARASTLPATLLGPNTTRSRADVVRMPGATLAGDYRLRLTLNDDAPDAHPGNNSQLSNSFRVVLPDLIVTMVSVAPAVLASGGNLSMTATILNVAAAPAAAGTTRAEWYLSRNRSLDGALLLGTTPVPPLGPGASTVLRQLMPLPGILAAGRYFGMVRVDPGNAIREAREDNNGGASPTSVLVGAEVAVTALTATPARVVPGGNVTAMATIRNSGGDAAAVSGVYTLVPVNSAGNPTGPDIPLGPTASAVVAGARGATLPQFTLGPNATRTSTYTTRVPLDTAVGNFRLRLRLNLPLADADPATDSQLSNGFQVVAADLAVRSVSSTRGVGYNISTTATIVNLGVAGSAPATGDVYVSRNRTYESATYLGSAQVPALAPGAATTLMTRLAEYLQPGSYYTFVEVNAAGTTPEVRRDNNVGISDTTFVVPPFDSDGDGLPDATDPCPYSSGTDQGCAQVVAFTNGGFAYCPTQTSCATLTSAGGPCVGCSMSSPWGHTADCQRRTGSVCLMQGDGTVRVTGGTLSTPATETDCDGGTCQGFTDGGSSCEAGANRCVTRRRDGRTTSCPSDRGCTSFYGPFVRNAADLGWHSTRVEIDSEGGDGVLELDGDVTPPGGPSSIRRFSIETRDGRSTTVKFLHGRVRRNGPDSYTDIRLLPRAGAETRSASCQPATDTDTTTPGRIRLLRKAEGDHACRYRIQWRNVSGFRSGPDNLTGHESVDPAIIIGPRPPVAIQSPPGARPVAVASGHVILAGNNGFVVVDPATNQVPVAGQRRVSFVNQFLGPMVGALTLASPAGDGRDAILTYGPAGTTLRYYDPDFQDFGFTQITPFPAPNITDGVHLGGDPTALGAILVNFSGRSVGAEVPIQGQDGLFSYTPSPSILATSASFAGASPVTAFAWDLQFNPDGTRSATSAGRVLVATDGAPGQLYLVDPATPFTAATLIGALGDSPRRIRCVPGLGLCAVSSFVSDLLTIVRWDGRANASIVGTVPVGDGPVGIGIRADGANAKVISTGFNDGTLTVTTLGPDGTVLSNVTQPVPTGCVNPGHATWVQTLPNTAVVTCQGSNGYAVVSP